MISLDRWLRLANTPAYIPKPWLAMEQHLYPGGNATCPASARCGTILRRQTLFTCRYLILPTPLPLISKRCPSLFVVGLASLLGRRIAWRHGRTFCFVFIWIILPLLFLFLFLFSFSLYKFIKRGEGIMTRQASLMHRRQPPT